MTMYNRKSKIDFLRGLERGNRSIQELNENYNNLKIVTGVPPDTTKFFRGEKEITQEEYARISKFYPSEFKVTFMTDEEYEKYFPNQ